jgi:hypothetical protein
MKKPKNTPEVPPREPVPTGTPEPSPAEIAALAYQIWEQEGRPEGRDLDHWLMAREQLRQGGSPAAKPGA